MTIPAALQAHYDSGYTCVSHGLYVVRDDGTAYGFTSNDQSFVMDVTAWGGVSGQVFSAEQGLLASNIVSTAGFNVDNLDLTTLDDGTLFDRDEIQAGLWRNAQFWLFRYRWDVSPVTIADDVEIVKRGWFGEISYGGTTIKVELRGLKQLLQQPVGIVSSKTCRARLGSTTGPNKCLKDLTSFTHSGTVSAVTDKGTFTASALGLADDYLGEGLITWLTGNNAGVTQKVRSHTAAGVITFVQKMVQDIQVGDTFTAVAGCRKRLTEDCKTKFNNVVNFQGEPHRPGIDALTSPGGANV